MGAIVNSQQQDGATHRNYGWLTLLLGTVVTMLISLYISGVDDATTIPTSASKLSLWYSHMSVIAVGFLAGSVAFDSAFRQGVAMAAVALWFLICVVERMMKPMYGHVLIAVYVSILCGFFMKRDKSVYKYSMPRSSRCRCCLRVWSASASPFVEEGRSSASALTLATPKCSTLPPASAKRRSTR